MSTNMRRRFGIPFTNTLLFVCLFVLSFFSASSLRSHHYNKHRVPSPSEASRTSLLQPSGGLITLISSPIPGDLVSPEEAITRLPYFLPKVEYLPDGGRLSELWVSTITTPVGDRSLAMVFDNGITLIVHQERGSLNLDNLAAEPPFQLVNVNDREGVGKNPGDQVLSDSSNWHYPGSVKWQVGNLVLTVYGEYSLEELIKVAESIHL